MNGLKEEDSQWLRKEWMEWYEGEKEKRKIRDERSRGRKKSSKP